MRIFSTKRVLRRAWTALPSEGSLPVPLSQNLIRLGRRSK